MFDYYFKSHLPIKYPSLKLVDKLYRGAEDTMYNEVAIVFFNMEVTFIYAKKKNIFGSKQMFTCTLLVAKNTIAACDNFLIRCPLYVTQRNVILSLKDFFNEICSD